MTVTRYNRQADFTGYEAANPSTPKRGTDLDAEFDALKVTSDQTQDNLSQIQRDDLKLRNLAVHPDALSNAVRALVLLQGADIRGAWQGLTVYAQGDVVAAPNGAAFICFAAHTSSLNFEADQPDHWLVIADAVNVVPRMWTFVGDGATTQFFIPGADVTDERLYEVVVGGVAQQPDTDEAAGAFEVTITPDTDGSFITLATAPGNLVDGWVVLRGYPQTTPLDFVTNLTNSQEFIDFLSSLITNTIYESTTILQLGALRSLIPLADIAGTAATLDGGDESHLLRCTNAAATTLTIRNNTGDADLDWAQDPAAAPYFSVKAAGAGGVTIVGAPGVTVTPPPGYLAKTRALGSIVTATGDYIAGGQWVLTGDLAIDPNYVDGQALARFNKKLDAAFSSVATALADITGWSFPVASGKTYRIRVLGTYQTAATTTGGVLGLGASGGAAGIINGRAIGGITAAAAATALAGTFDALTDSLITTGVSAINTPHWIELDVVLVCTVSGIVAIRWASEVAASAAQMNAGSLLMVEEVGLTP